MIPFDLLWNNSESDQSPDSIHRRCLLALESIDNISIVNSVLKYLHEIEWDATVHEGCKSQVYLRWTSLATLEIAERIVLRIEPEAMLPIYRKFFDTLSWEDAFYHRRTVGEWAVKGFAKALGTHAVDELMNHIIWSHAKFECVTERDYYDDRVFDAITSIGEEAVPILLNYLNTDYGRVVLQMLKCIGGRSGEHVADKFHDGFDSFYIETIWPIVEYLFEEGHAKALDIALVGLLYCRYS
ncbi:MAG: hypothetical protein EAX81_06830 [Candidatus Thorarchaeota archaeon]|nr:hypothetical protein [Candidatus Thorarchaeota archaeon]